MKVYEFEHLIDNVNEDISRIKERIAIFLDENRDVVRYDRTSKAKASLKRQIIETRESLNKLNKALNGQWIGE